MNEEILEQLKRLARLDCTPEEGGEILSSLTRVLDYVKQLGEVETEGVPPCRYVLRGMLKNPLRSDRVENVLPRETFLANAPDQIGGMIKVPPVLKTP